MLHCTCLLLIERERKPSIILLAEGVTLNWFVARPIASSLVANGTGATPSEELDPLATRDRHLPSI